MIKVVIFDVGGVLVKWSRDAIDNDIKTELNLSEEQYSKFWEDYVRPFSRGEITEVEIWENATRELGIRPVALEEDLIGRSFAKSSVPYKQMILFVESLKARGFRVAILSNNNEIHTASLRKKKVFEPFKDVFLSQNLGMRKPDPAIYEHVLKELNVKPDETIFIDDALENIEAAQKLGMHTVIAKTPKQIINDIKVALK